MKPYVWICLIALIVACTPTTGPHARKSSMDAAKMMDQGQTTEAVQLLGQLAEQDDDSAMVQLGVCHLKGVGVPQNYDKAMDLLLHAYAHENADAFVIMGIMHRDGLGVPPNRKIAYSVFLTTHMRGLGTQATQYHSNSCLRQLIAELPKDDIKDCLSNYTPGYITAYLESRGKIAGIPDRYKPSEENPALRDLGWFLDSELDAIYGEPTEEEKRARKERARKWQHARDKLRHTMVFQIRFPREMVHQYRRYEVITDDGMASGPFRERKLDRQDGDVVYENSSLIWADRHRYVTIETRKNEALVFAIDHPVKPEPCDWSAWQKADYILGNHMESFALLHGKEPESKRTDVPPNSPALRFKIIKE